MNIRDRHRLESHARRIEELRLWRNAREPHRGVALLGWRREGKEIRLGDFWPEEALPASFSVEAKIPEDWAGSPVELELWLGGEGFVSSLRVQRGPQPFPPQFPVTQEAAGGETIGIEAEVVPRGMFGSNVAAPQLRRSSLVVPEQRCAPWSGTSGSSSRSASSSGITKWSSPPRRRRRRVRKPVLRVAFRDRGRAYPLPGDLRRVDRRRSVEPAARA